MHFLSAEHGCTTRSSLEDRLPECHHTVLWMKLPAARILLAEVLFHQSGFTDMTASPSASAHNQRPHGSRVVNLRTQQNAPRKAAPQKSTPGVSATLPCRVAINACFRTIQYISSPGKQLQSLRLLLVFLSQATTVHCSCRDVETFHTRAVIM